MGYTTRFKGRIKVTPPMSAAEIKYINTFNESRRMDREAGPYFVGGTGEFGQGNDPDIRDRNHPDPSQPSLWCQWRASDDGECIEWDEGEKFYEAGEWMEYIIDHFIGANPIAKTQGSSKWLAEHLQSHVCNGVINAFGEERDDIWNIVVNNNKVSVVQGSTLPLELAIEVVKQNETEIKLLK